ISIEDPIEFLHQPIKGAITQRQVGKHAESFSSALRSALRESPDVLVVGEMRDLETIHLAIAAAETGVLVIGTLHSNGAAKAIDRYLDTASNDGSGMQSLDFCLFNLLKQGEITVEEGIKLANQPQSLKRLAAELRED